MAKLNPKFLILFLLLVAVTNIPLSLPKQAQIPLK